MSGTAKPPTDRELRLQALRRRFLSEAAAEQVELGRLLADGVTAGRYRKVVHDLRGAGGSYGYPEISAAAERLEETLRAGGTDLGPLLATLGEAIAAAGRA